MVLKKRYFGTDGIRGFANREPITVETLVRIGRAAACFFKEKHSGCEKLPLMIGKDPRISSDMVESSITAGLLSAGMDVSVSGVITTPALGYLVRTSDSSGGIMVSASHNPFHDNGIKFFNSRGEKLTDEDELEIESIMERDFSSELSSGADIGKRYQCIDARKKYLCFLKDSIFPGENSPLSGVKVVLDCANGAAYKLAPEFLTSLGAELITTGVSPDGVNINDGVGALYPEKVSNIVKEGKFDAGICLDGDGDRIICVDEKGDLIDGDKLMGIFAREMKNTNRLKNNMLVTTVMTNSGLDKFLDDNDISMLRTDVGDRYVARKMRETGAVLGGESSGHIIFSEANPTGDALIAAAETLKLLKKNKKPLSFLSKEIKLLPQIKKTVRVNSKPPIEEIAILDAAVKSAEKKLDGGRILMRYSGTEPLMRVMAESNNKSQAEIVTDEISSIVKKILGD